MFWGTFALEQFTDLEEVTKQLSSLDTLKHYTIKVGCLGPTKSRGSGKPAYALAWDPEGLHCRNKGEHKANNLLRVDQNISVCN